MLFSKILKLDWVLLVVISLLLAVGLLALYSVSVAGAEGATSIFFKQMTFAILGVIIMAFFASFNYHYLKSYSTTIYFATLFILALVLIWGSVVRGTSGWIGIGSFNIQPVEIAKLALIIFLASFISQKKYQLGETARLAASFILTVIMIFLVMKQPDVGSALILLGIWLGMMLMSGINKKHLFFLILIGAVLVSVSWFFLADYQKARILNVVSPDVDPRGSGYNVIQSMVSVGSGGTMGKGLGHGSQSQLNFLPEKHTDFIFAVIAEESGLLGSVFVLLLYTVLFYRIKIIAEFAEDNFSYLLASGILIMFSLQIFINIGMNVGIVPVAGIPLPFLSYGGSSLVTSFISLGILMNIYRRRKSILKSQAIHSY